jgi:hypothetical protein
MAIRTIYICPYSHSDWAWVARRRWHEKRYIRAFEIVLNLMNKGTGFTWFIDSWHEQFEPVREYRPDLVEQMKKHVAAGSFGLGSGMFTNLDPFFCDGETYVRNVLYGQRRFEELFPGAKFRIFSHIDCAIGNTQTPQLAEKMGFDVIMFHRPEQVLKDKGIPRQFLWRGLDGTEMPVDSLQAYAMFEYSPRNPDSLFDYLNDEIASSEERGCGEALIVLSGFDDDCLPLDEPGSEYDLFGKMKQWNDSQKVELKLGIPDDFTEKMVEYSDGLPVVEGNPDPIGCPYRTTENAHENIIDQRFRCAISLAQAERAWMHSGAPFPEDDLRFLWEELLSVYPHAVEWLWKRDALEFRARAESTIRAVEKSRAAARRLAAEHIKPVTEGRPIVFFNPLPFDREEPVEFYFARDEAGPLGYTMVDGSGKNVPCQIFGDSFRGLGRDSKRMRCEYRVTAKIDVPASGYSTAYMRGDDSGEDSGKFEISPRNVDCGRLKIEMPNGTPGEVSLEGAGRLLERIDITFVEFEETMSPADEHRMATVIGLHGPATGDRVRNKDIDKQVAALGSGVPCGTARFTADEWSLMESGVLTSRVFMTGAVAGNPTEVEMVVRGTEARIDFDIKSYVIQPRCGYFFASLKPLFSGETYVDVPFGVEPRDPESEPFGLEYVERGFLKTFWGTSWADYSDGAQGVALLASPGLIGFRTEDGLFENLLLKTIAPQNVPGARWAHDGRTGLGCERMKFSVFLHRGDWRSARVYREAQRYREPVSGEDVLYPLKGDQDDTQRGLAVWPENITVSAFFEDRGVPVLRIYENEGTGVSAKIALPYRIERVEMVNLLGKPIEDDRRIVLSGESIAVGIEPWEILTFRLYKG